MKRIFWVLWSGTVLAGLWLYVSLSLRLMAVTFDADLAGLPAALRESGYGSAAWRMFLKEAMANPSFLLFLAFMTGLCIWKITENSARKRKKQDQLFRLASRDYSDDSLDQLVRTREQEQRRLEQGLRRDLILQKEFTENFSHQLLSSISGVRMCVELTETARGEKTREYLRLADHQLERSEDLLRQLLSGAMNFEHQQLDTLIRKCIRQSEQNAKERNIRITADLERVSMYLMPLAVAEMVNTLLDNALRHADRGTDLQISLHHKSNHAILHILQTGGCEKLDPESFTRYRTRDSGHYGIGLDMVQTIVGLHGGTVRIRKSENGAETTVRLPVASLENDQL